MPSRAPALLAWIGVGSVGPVYSGNEMLVVVELPAIHGLPAVSNARSYTSVVPVDPPRKDENSSALPFPLNSEMNASQRLKQEVLGLFPSNGFWSGKVVEPVSPAT